MRLSGDRESKILKGRCCVMKRVLYLCLCLAVLCSGILPAPPACAKDGRVTILTINHLLGQLLPVVEKVNRDTLFRGGLAKAATVIQQIRKKDPNAILAVTGESVFGPIWRYFGGQPEFTSLSLIGVQVGMISKHELDYGWSHLESALQYVTYPMLLSNATVPQNMVDRLRKTVIVTYKDLNVGIFAMISPTLFAATTRWGAENSDNADFRIMPDIVGSAREMTKALKEQGADVIVMFGDLTEEENDEVARAVSGIHLIFGRGSNGESPSKPVFVTNEAGWTTMLAWGGDRGRFIGKVNLEVKDGRLVKDNSTWEVVLVTQKTPFDQNIYNIASDFEEKLNAQREKIIGSFETEVNTQKPLVRSREMPIGNFLADALRNVFKTDVGLVNGGAIRADKTFSTGNFSERTFLEIFPYGNEVTLVTVPGRILRQAMECSASALIAGPEDDYDTSRRTPTGGFLQVSGIRVVYDLKKQPMTFNKETNQVDQRGERLVTLAIQREGGHWAEVDDDAQYTVALSAYLANGGDRYFMFKDVPQADTGVSDLDTTLRYIRTFSEGRLNLTKDGRITILTQEAPQRKGN